MEYANLLGLAAGTLTTAAFVPQAVKAANRPSLACGPRLDPIGETWRTRSTHDISLGMFALFNSGLVLWLLYGVQIGSVPIVIANTITLAFASIILYFKLRYK
jgi:MtN3 and saliva related transmembrane protein